MHRLISLTCVALLLFVAAAMAGQIDGPMSISREIGQAVGGEPTAYEMTVSFRGGERACVVAQGDHDPVVPLDIAVYDKQDRLIAKDESQYDFVSVCWVPPRTGAYRVVIRNHGDKIYNKVYIFSK
jgi:hypothetical protein